MRRTIRALVAAGAIAVLPAAVPAVAQERETAVFAGNTALAEADLGGIAGREDRGAQIAAADQRNTVSNNSVTGTSVTGSVTIDGQAFSNLSGLAVISANSGNNVAINSAMNVVINLAPQ